MRFSTIPSHIIAALCLLCSSVATSTSARAQTETPAETAAILEGEVIDALLREGLSLARLGYRLELTLMDGADWRVVLRDRASGTMVMERRVNDLSTDRQVAIATLSATVSAMLREYERGDGATTSPAGAPAGGTVGAPAGGTVSAPAGGTVSEPGSGTEGAVDPVAVPVSSEELAENKQQYAQEFVWFEDMYLVTVNTGKTSRRSMAFQGRYKKELPGKKFYQVIGREDLAGRYSTRQRLRWGVMGLGAAIAVGGMGYMFWKVSELEDCQLGVDFDECMDRKGAQFKRGVTVAIAGVLVGIVTVGAGYQVKPHPVSASRRRALADEYNGALRKELGLPEDYEVRPMSRRSAPSVHMSAFVDEHGGGISVFGNF